MVDSEEKDKDKESDAGAVPLLPQAASGKKTFDNLLRSLTDDEFSQSGVRKLLLKDHDDLESCQHDLEKVRTDFHEADKERSILKEKLFRSWREDTLFNVTLAIGILLIGIAAGGRGTLTTKVADWDIAMTATLAGGLILCIAALAVRYRK